MQFPHCFASQIVYKTGLHWPPRSSVTDIWRVSELKKRTLRPRKTTFFISLALTGLSLQTWLVNQPWMCASGNDSLIFFRQKRDYSIPQIIFFNSNILSLWQVGFLKNALFFWSTNLDLWRFISKFMGWGFGLELVKSSLKEVRKLTNIIQSHMLHRMSRSSVKI